jgi:hypothetical protein
MPRLGGSGRLLQDGVKDTKGGRQAHLFEEPRIGREQRIPWLAREVADLEDAAWKGQPGGTAGLLPGKRDRDGMPTLGPDAPQLEKPPDAAEDPEVREHDGQPKTVHVGAEFTFA